MKVSPRLPTTAQEEKLVDVDELRVPARELLAAIRDLVAITEDPRGNAEPSLIDRQPCPPRMMLAAITYCYLLGLYGSAQIREALKGDELRSVIGCQPDEELLREFRRKNRRLIKQSLRHVRWFIWMKYASAQETSGTLDSRRGKFSRKIESESEASLSRAVFVDKMMSE